MSDPIIIYTDMLCEAMKASYSTIFMSSAAGTISKRQNGCMLLPRNFGTAGFCPLAEP